MKGRGSAHSPPRHAAIFRSPGKSSSSAASAARPRRGEDKINNPCKCFVGERLHRFFFPSFFKMQSNSRVELAIMRRERDNRRGRRAAFSPLPVKLHLPPTARPGSFTASNLWKNIRVIYFHLNPHPSGIHLLGDVDGSRGEHPSC